MRRPVRLAVPLAVAGALLSGCGFSAIAPDAQVRVSGHVVDAEGHPLAGATVLLIKEPDLGEFAFGTAFAIASLGAACLLPNDEFPGNPARSVCGGAVRATTDSTGSYHYTLHGRDTQGSIGQESTLDVIVADPRGGARAGATTLRFEVATAGTSLPVAHLWDAAPHVSEASGRIAVGWQPLPAADGTDVSYSVGISGAGGQGTLWSQPATATGTDVDPRVIEDVRSLATAAASASLTGGARAVYTSADRDVPAPAGAPPSRGHPCSAVAGSDLSGTPQPVCRLTDGDLTTAAHLSGPRQTVVSGALVDLGTARRLTLVVLRGFGGQVTIEGSADGVAYTQLGTADTSPSAVSIAGATARFVRVRSPSGLDESLTTELSAW